ncbi:MAG: hypothetical protein U9N04_01285 [Patescibacteria group bacterium]|nr:hypothetical protein [Patescibacteria group bacterium]
MKKIEKEIIEKTFSLLGLSNNLMTNPTIINQVLKETRLNDLKTKNKVINKFLQESKTKPKKLDSMYEIIKKAIQKKHPAIIEFLEIGNKKKWFKPSKNIIKAVHVAYILEAFTATMCNDHDFFVEVQNHYKKKEKELGLNTQHPFRTFINALKISPHFFDIAKPFSLDPFLVYFKLQRDLSKTQLQKEELKKLYGDEQINYIEYRLLSPIKQNHIQHINELVRINIYEAGTTEYRNDFNANALCAHTLCEDLKVNRPKTIFERKVVIPESKNSFYKSFTKSSFFPTIETSQEWASLYTSWNMAFVLGNLDNLELIMPKLFIPSLIDAKSENFLGVRFISLWLTINFGIFRKSDKIEILGPENKSEMTKTWANINKKYAFAMAKNEIHEDSKMLNKYYKRFFSHPFWNLFKLARNFD